MAKGPPPLLQELRAVFTSRRGVAIAKGLLAYVLAFVLCFIKDFDHLSAYPQVLSAMFIIVIAGSPGKSIGTALGGAILAAAGVLVGCLNFFVLAKLAHSPVGQAFYFAFVVYVLAWIKSLGMQYFGFSLLAILMSFNGVYTSYALGGRFDKHYLFAYLEAYMWGVAVVLFVAFFIFPLTAEKELRKLLVVSMEHIETFGMLISKSYLMILTPEDKILRDRFAQTIRADFGLLQQKLEETKLEINWSKWSMDDYRHIIKSIRTVQQALISTHSSITVLETKTDELYRTTFLPKSLKAYNKVRLDMRLTIQEVKAAFGADSLGVPRCLWDSYIDIERQAALVAALPDEEVPAGTFDDGIDRTEQLRAVARRLAEEFEQVDPDGDENQNTDGHVEHASLNDPSSTQVPSLHRPASMPPQNKTDAEKDLIEKALKQHGPQALEADFEAFSNVQYDLITTAITGGTLTDCTGNRKLRIHTAQPSVFEAYGNDYVRGVLESQGNTAHGSPVSSGPATPVIRRRKPKSDDDGSQNSFEDEKGGPDSDEEAIEQTGNHSLIMVYSLLFALSQYVQEIKTLHARVTAKDSKGRTKRKRLHFHFFESLATEHSSSSPDDLSLPEALAVLESKQYTRHVTTWADRLHRFRLLALGPNSMFAAKTAAAVSTFAILIYADTTRAWFISYSLSGGLLTIVVALAPTLGQSALTFILQIAGSSIGYLMGLAILSIFHNVGGYEYNPYGMVCLLAIYALPFIYIIYERPKFFALGLLALNSTGVSVLTEWIYRDWYHRLTFDRPAYRTGKGLTSLAIAVAISGIFQLFIARNPARRTLRKALAKLTYDNLAYLTMLQAFVRAVVPADATHHVPQAAVDRVYRELLKREIKIQGEIISLMPLITFAKAEPSLTRKFDPSYPLRIIKVNQVILDRLREGRAAVGTTRLDEAILKHFVAVLSPYRRRSTRITKTALGMCAASLTSKLPLPQEMPLMDRNDTLSDFVHDALILSYRFARTEEGRAAVRSGEFTRYWFYVLSVSSILPQLEDLEAVIKEMFGTLENSLA